jgi:hypothetical protein
VITWRVLCELDPAFRQFEADARSFAAFGRDWYLHWIGGFHDLRVAVTEAAAQHGLEREELADVAGAALRGVYRTERLRYQRRQAAVDGAKRARGPVER